MQEKKDLVTTKTHKEEENIDILSLLGIKVDNGKIEIDTNATKSFFENLQNRVKSTLTQIEEEVKEGKIDLKDSVGIRVDESKVEIDLNKAKNFLNELANKVQKTIESVDKTIKNLDPKS